MTRTDDKGDTSYTLMGSLDGCDTYGKERSPDAGTDVQKFYNFLFDLQERIIQSAVENSVKWFGKKRSEEGIREGFNPIIGISKNKVDGEYVANGKYPPSFKTKVPVYDNRVMTEIVDASRNPVYATPESLTAVFPKQMDANLVVTGSIYVIAGGGFGVSWRLQTAQVFAKPRMTAADIFNDESSSTVTLPQIMSPAVEELDESERPSTPVESQTQPAAPNAPARKRRVQTTT
jgi:hypothetical protein